MRKPKTYNIRNPYYVPALALDAPMNPKQFINEACKQLKINEKELKSTTRKREIVMARAAIILRMLVLFNKLTLQEIGSFVNRNHSTVMFYRDRMCSDPILDDHLTVLKHIGL